MSSTANTTPRTTHQSLSPAPTPRSPPPTAAVMDSQSQGDALHPAQSSPQTTDGQTGDTLAHGTSFLPDAGSASMYARTEALKGRLDEEVAQRKAAERTAEGTEWRASAAVWKAGAAEWKARAAEWKARAVEWKAEGAEGQAEAAEEEAEAAEQRAGTALREPEAAKREAEAAELKAELAEREAGASVQRAHFPAVSWCRVA